MRSWVEPNNRVKVDLIPISEFNGYEFISLIGLRLRLGGCEVMGRARSCGKMVLMSISKVNEKDLIYFS